MQFVYSFFLIKNKKKFVFAVHILEKDGNLAKNKKFG